MQALRGVYVRGGLPAFWAGFAPKMVEAASKGAVFMYSKEVYCVRLSLERVW